jgi:hypothetical protein
MGSKRFSGSLFVMLVLGFLLGVSRGYKFYVGGKDGWATNPSERYSHWAERNRFQVNDTLCKLNSFELFTNYMLRLFPIKENNYFFYLWCSFQVQERIGFSLDSKQR